MDRKDEARVEREASENEQAELRRRINRVEAFVRAQKLTLRDERRSQ